MKMKQDIKWESLNWKKIHLRVWRIQKQIYCCSKELDFNGVTKLQKNIN
jgi:hypothetical protein